MIAACVPVKRLSAGKSRLLDGIGREAIEQLVLCMLGDIVDSLLAAPELDPVGVVTPDPAVAEAAERLGAHPILRSDPGLNPSLDAAAREIVTTNHGALLVVLGDVAGIRRDDVHALVEALAGIGGQGVVLSPSRDGGTSALLRAPHDVIPNRFGKDSAAAHRELAQRGGVPYCELPLPSLAVDVDRPEDLRAFLEGPGDGPRTRKLLGKLVLGDLA